MNTVAYRWIVDPPADGPTNMARDEAMLQMVGTGESPPTLRFYLWEPPTISLGYFQRYADFEALPPPAGELAVVRRQTGGGAILHDLELTYSVVLPARHSLIARNPNNLYRHVHTAFASLLADIGVPVAGGTCAGGCSHRGPFFCFERHSGMDLLVRNRKLMGSAQRRTRDAVLQHGSLILDSRFPQQQCATVAAYARWDEETALPRLAALIAGARVGAPGHLTEAENALTADLRGKYASDTWNRAR